MIALLDEEHWTGLNELSSWGADILDLSEQPDGSLCIKISTRRLRIIHLYVVPKGHWTLYEETNEPD